MQDVYKRQASNNPIGVIFTGCFMSMLNISGMELKTLTAYNEYITDIIIASIVYLSAFAMLIKMFLNKRQKKKKEAAEAQSIETTAVSYTHLDVYKRQILCRL